ncbi:peroxiredoxin [Fulvitalea axinellae]|uniref:Peroxiredoxin n=1 Tax=Fulvitalea axinellae TaxID=1182444 RepID=A0AAU9CQF1_9BACT|nr:peroxiredoxin [Fulvitalea axinellae]
MSTHNYLITTEWTGNKGQGTAGYRSYSRDHRFISQGKADIAGSSDPAFLGDPTRHNPEELLLASLSSCHMLWYLHLCAEAGISVTAYTDRATAKMDDGSATTPGRMTEVMLRPEVTIGVGDPEQALALHAQAHRMCFIANSCNFPVRHEPVISAEADT